MSEKMLVLMGAALPPGEHIGPVVAGRQDGVVVCQCLTCGKTWDSEGRIRQEAESECREEEEAKA